MSETGKLDYKSIYKKTEEYRKLWMELSEIMIDESVSFDQMVKLKAREDEAYKKWVFYSKMLKQLGASKTTESEKGKTR